MANHDLESGENRVEARRTDLPQRRANNRRHGAGVRRPRVTRAGSQIAATAKLAADLVPFFGLLFSLFSILITLMQIKYLNGDTSPYITNPSSMAICLVALCIFAFTVGFKMVRQTLYGNCPAHITNRVILISGVLVIVAIVSIIVTNWLSWIIYVTWVIFSVMVMAWNLNLLTRFKQRFLINGSRTLVELAQGPSNV